MGFTLSARARRDLDAVLEYSLNAHGPEAAKRYSLLLAAAMGAIAAKPDLPGARPVARRPGNWTCALAKFRTLVPAEHRVRKPAHLVVFRHADDGDIEIVAIVGESDPAERLAGRSLVRPRRRPT